MPKIVPNGDGKSAVPIPDGRNRKRKKTRASRYSTCVIIGEYPIKIKVVFI